MNDGGIISLITAQRTVRGTTTLVLLYKQNQSNLDFADVSYWSGNIILSQVSRYLPTLELRLAWYLPISRLHLLQYLAIPDTS